MHFMLHVYTHGLYIRTKQILKAVAKTAYIYTQFRVCHSIFVVTVHADYLHVFHVF